MLKRILSFFGYRRGRNRITGYTDVKGNYYGY